MNDPSNRAYTESLNLIVTVLSISAESQLAHVVQNLPAEVIYQLGHYLIFAIDNLDAAEYEQTLIDDVIGYRDNPNYIGKTKEF